ncbi:hypothetical protein K1720_07445 [Thermococcus argininiproducens]|uniref:Uncharacterized protein n=1 Tax=Thermococcus argininiproducens TaxID=2866384 RepID=A0A9E7SBX8_9EURY|nr:hypothetical protein [Thermococcus argininiproducens]USG99363.1 hypothetical protein K1720_07445 [Thermococcus argininiproducens]
MRKLLTVGLVFVVLSFLAVPMSARPCELSEKARIYVGWEGYFYQNLLYGQVVDPSNTLDSWMVVKWSKSWSFPFGSENDPEKSWFAVHFTWYTNDLSGFFGYETRVAWNNVDEIPDASYKVEEYVKIMIIGENSKYIEKGAYPAASLGYPFPNNAYVIHQTVEVYNATTGEILFEITFVPFRAS